MNNENVMDATIDEVDELYHYGVPGMKWGVRRTPAQLGHKPPSKKRRASAKKYVESLMKNHKAKKEAKKAAEEERKKDAALKKKSISEMSDDELATYITRKNAERMAFTLERDINSLKPEKVSAGKKFADGVMSKLTATVADGVSNATRSLLQNAVDKALGQGAYDPLNKLKREAEKAGYKQQISKAIQEGYRSEQERIRAEKDAWNFDNDRKGRARAEANAKKASDEEARKANEERSRREYEKTGGAYRHVPNPSKAKENVGRSNSSDKVNAVEVIDRKPKLLGSGNSSSKKSTIIDADGWTVSDASNSSYRSQGQSYVSGYLSDPASGTSSSTRQLGQTYIAGLLPAPKDDD